MYVEKRFPGIHNGERQMIDIDKTYVGKERGKLATVVLDALSNNEGTQSINFFSEGSKKTLQR